MSSMSSVDFRKVIVVSVAFIAMAYGVSCQSVSLNTNRAESVIDHWNSASNDRNFHGFEKVYGEYLILDNKRVSKATAIARKRQIFQDNPGFRQQITTAVIYKPFSTQVTRAEFTREIFERSSWKKSPYYLLISYEGDRYVIVGEGNALADEPWSSRKSEIGDPVTAEDRLPDSVAADTVFTQTPLALPPMEHPDSIDDDHVSPLSLSTDTVGIKLTLSDLEAFFSDFSSLGVVVVPRSYLFILVALLALGGMMIVVADSLRSRRRDRKKPVRVNNGAERVVRDLKAQTAFEAFVVTLFDPLFFRLVRTKTEYAMAGSEPDVDDGKGPDRVFSYHQKETRMRFAIICQYYRHAGRNVVRLLPHTRQESVRKFETEREMAVYYVLGFGGKPDDPKELFFIPAVDVTSEYISRPQLMNYSKSGMFYYNRRTGRIQ